MKKFEIIKTVQLILYILLAGTALLTIFRDEELYQTIAADPHVRLLSIVLWLALGLALALGKGIKGERIFLSIYFMPVLISTVVIGQLWLKIYNPD